jgi:hypothetical protein
MALEDDDLASGRINPREGDDQSALYERRDFQAGPEEHISS